MLCILVAMGLWAGLWLWQLTAHSAKVKERVVIHLLHRDVIPCKCLLICGNIFLLFPHYMLYLPYLRIPSTCHPKIYYTFWFVMKVTCVCYREVSLSLVSFALFDLLAFSSKAKPSPLCCSGWLSSWLEEVSSSWMPCSNTRLCESRKVQPDCRRGWWCESVLK